eukprot:256917_1
MVLREITRLSVHWGTAHLKDLEGGHGGGEGVLLAGLGRDGGLLTREALGTDLSVDLVAVGAGGDGGAEAVAHLLELGGGAAGLDQGLDDEVAETVVGGLLQGSGVEDELVQDQAAEVLVTHADDLLADVAAELVGGKAEELAVEAVHGVAGGHQGLGVLEGALHHVVAEGIAGEVGEGLHQGLGKAVLLLGVAALKHTHEADASLLGGGEVLGVGRHDVNDVLQVARAVALEQGLEDLAGVLAQGAHVEDQLAVEDVHQLAELVLVDDLDQGADDVAAVGVEHHVVGISDDLVEDGLDLVQVLEAHHTLQHGAAVGGAGHLGEAADALSELLHDRVAALLLALHGTLRVGVLHAGLVLLLAVVVVEAGGVHHEGKGLHGLLVHLVHVGHVVVVVAGGGAEGHAAGLGHVAAVLHGLAAVVGHGAHTGVGVEGVVAVLVHLVAGHGLLGGVGFLGVHVAGLVVLAGGAHALAGLVGSHPGGVGTRAHALRGTLLHVAGGGHAVDHLLVAGRGGLGGRWGLGVNSAHGAVGGDGGQRSSLHGFSRCFVWWLTR